MTDDEILTLRAGISAARHQQGQAVRAMIAAEIRRWADLIETCEDLTLAFQQTKTLRASIDVHARLLEHYSKTAPGDNARGEGFSLDDSGEIVKAAKRETAGVQFLREAIGSFRAQAEATTAQSRAQTRRSLQGWAQALDTLRASGFYPGSEIYDAAEARMKRDIEAGEIQVEVQTSRTSTELLSPEAQLFRYELARPRSSEVSPSRASPTPAPVPFADALQPLVDQAGSFLDLMESGVGSVIANDPDVREANRILTEALEADADEDPYSGLTARERVRRGDGLPQVSSTELGVPEWSGMDDFGGSDFDGPMPLDEQWAAMSPDATMPP